MAYRLNEYDIRKYVSDGNIFIDGKKSFLLGDVKKIEIVDFDSKDFLFDVNGKQGKSYKVNIWFDNDGKIEGHNCSCYESRFEQSMCVHAAAALFAFINFSVNDKKGKRSTKESFAVRECISYFENKLYKEIEDNIDFMETQKVSLEPKLRLLSENECYVDFFIGSTKMYVLKDIYQFIYNMYNHKVFKYGMKLEFKHTMSAFDEYSKNLIDFIMRQYEYALDYEATGMLFYYENIRNYAGSSSKSRSILLNKNGFDDFFDVNNGRMVRTEINFESKKILFSDKENDFEIFAKPYKRGLRLSLNSKVTLFEGNKYGYMIYNDTLYRVSKEYFFILDKIIETLRKTNKKTLTFFENETSKAFNFILPKLKEVGLLKDTDKIYYTLNYFPLEAKLYLDIEKESIVCRAEFCYGSEKFNSFESQNMSDLRNIAEEFKIKRILETLGFKKKDDMDYIMDDENCIFELYNGGLERLSKISEVFVTDNFSSRSIKDFKGSAVGLRIEGGLLELNLDISEFDKEELYDILDAYKARRKFYKLKSGDFLKLEENAYYTLFKTVDALDLSEKEFLNGNAVVPAYKALYLEGIFSEKEKSFIDIDKTYRSLVEAFSKINKQKLIIPEVFENVLRNYQKNGVMWLKALSEANFGGILADDMGLGKTLQIILLLFFEHESEGKPSLVVCPTSLVYNWENEIKKFAPMLKTVLVNGNPQKRIEILKGFENDNIYITTYDILKRDIESYKKLKFKYIIADEAQYIKNPSTQNAKALKKVFGEVKFALTGTPIENSLSELWAIFDFIMPGYLYNHEKFKKKYEIPIIKNQDKEASFKLKKHIMPFILRRTKSEVLRELPEKTEMILYAEMEDEQKKLYAANLLKARNELDSGFNRIKIFSQLMRLRQICCHPSLFTDNYKGKSSKLELALKTISEAIRGGHRILVFSQFTSMLRILRESLDKMNIESFYLDGGTRSDKRLEMVESFNDGENSVFLISLKAGGTGLNLTGADIVIHYDQWWNPAVMSQASDRAHRFGQKKNVQIINLVMKDSIEEKIIELQERKKDLVYSFISEGDDFFTKLTDEDILSLLKD